MSAMPEYAMTYVVVFQDAAGVGRHVVKVGRAWVSSRLNELARLGGQVILAPRGTDASWEREALRSLRTRFPDAFSGWFESEPVLGKGGKGYTECVIVRDEELQLALDLIIEGFARGNRRSVNQATHDQSVGLGAPRRRPARRYPARRVAVAESRPAGAGEVRRRLDRARRVPTGDSRLGGREGRGSRPGVRVDRRTVPHHVPSGWGGVVAAAASTEGRYAGCDDPHTGATVGVSMDVRGYGARGRGRAGGREGACAGAGAGGERRESSSLGRGTRGTRGRAGTPHETAADGRPTSVLLQAHAPRSGPEEVRSLSGYPPGSGRVAGIAGVRAEARGLLRADRRLGGAG